MKEEPTKKNNEQTSVESTTEEKKVIHVAYTVDVQGQGGSQFYQQMLVSLLSLRETGDNILAHIMFSNVSATFISDLYKLKTDKFDIECNHIPDSDMAILQRFTKHDPGAPVRPWSGIVYARLLLPKYLHYLDKVIYLDSDTMIRKSIMPLWEKDLEGKLLGMNFGIVPEYGYNSGVIVMDLKGLRETPDLYKDLYEFMEKNSRSFYLPDQTTINRFFEGKIMEIGREYNFPPTPGNHDRALMDASIWHFYNQPRKPYKIVTEDVGFTLMEWNKLAMKYGI